MFEEMTFENLLTQMLDNVQGDVDKREGSIIAYNGSFFMVIYKKTAIVKNNFFTISLAYMIA